MDVSLFFSILLLQFGAIPIIASALPEAINGNLALDKRVCNQDNVLRALEAHSSAASTFCATYNHMTTPSTTVTEPGATPIV